MLICYAWDGTIVSVEGSIWSDDEKNNDDEDDYDDAMMTSLKLLMIKYNLIELKENEWRRRYM